MPTFNPGWCHKLRLKVIFSSLEGGKQSPLVLVDGTNRDERLALVLVGGTNRDKMWVLVPVGATNQDKRVLLPTAKSLVPPR